MLPLPVSIQGLPLSRTLSAMLYSLNQLHWVVTLLYGRTDEQIHSQNPNILHDIQLFTWWTNFQSVEADIKKGTTGSYPEKIPTGSDFTNNVRSIS